MMKTYQKLVAGGLVVALSAGATFMYAGNRVEAGVGRETEVGISSGSKFIVTKTAGVLSTEKKEVVYVFAGADGKEDKIMVTDTLRNPDSLKSLVDITSLKDIVNVKGNEGFSQSGDSLIWQADGNDITYRGTTSKEAPVGVRILYFLDGKELSAQELVGKSGRVTIRFEYYNNSKETALVDGKQEEVVVPFAMATAVLLDEEKFTNIEVTHGKLLNEGNVCAAVLVGMPGLGESLGLSEDYWMDYAEITADMVDFSLTNTFTVATNSMFSGLSLDGSADIDSLGDALTKLGDATDELVDGTVKLKDGAAELFDGVKELSDGALKLNDGAKTLSDGASTLSDNMMTLSAGAGNLKDGAGALSAGINSFVEGVGSAKSGAEALVAGGKNLEEGAAQFKAGVGAVSQGMESLAAGSKELSSGAVSVHEGVTGLSAGIDQLSGGLKNLDAGMVLAY